MMEIMVINYAQSIGFKAVAEARWSRPRPRPRLRPVPSRGHCYKVEANILSSRPNETINHVIPGVSSCSVLLTKSRSCTNNLCLLTDSATRPQNFTKTSHIGTQCSTYCCKSSKSLLFGQPCMYICL